MRGFLTDRRASILPIYALAVSALVICAGVVLDYSRGVNFNSRVQAATDAAALETTKAIAFAMQNGSANFDPQQVATTFFAANAPPNALQEGTLTVDYTNTNGSIAATVNYRGNMPTLFAGVLGQSAIPIKTRSGAEIAIGGSGGGPKSYTANGQLWDDPFLDLPDGRQVNVRCGSSPQNASAANWYNLLSDAGFEANFSCVTLPVELTDLVANVSITVGSHVISIPGPYITNRGWDGAVVVDGAAYPSGWWNNQTVLADGAVTMSWPYVVVSSPGGTYSVWVQYAAGDFWAGWLLIYAKDAGACGSPGGMWGSALGGKDDDTNGWENTQDFLVNASTATAAEFSRANCRNGSPAMAHLVR